MARSDWRGGWQYRAACRGEDTGLFFPPHAQETADERRGREVLAKTICAGCDVRVDCLEYALRTQEPYGVWGGLNESERRSVLRERRRQELAAG